MSTKLNVAEKYQIEYADCSYFPNMQIEFNLLLEKLINQYCHKDDDWVQYSSYSAATSDIIEINKKTLHRLIQRMSELGKDEILLSEKGNSDNQYTAKEVIDILSYMLNKADPDLDYVHIEWF